MFERFFWDDDGTLTDQTREWSDPYSSTALWDAKSYLYVSSFFPFNHKFFDIATANDQSGTLSVDIWYNDAWNAVVDMIDYTDNGSGSFRQSGNIVFIPDNDKGWDQESDSSDITELADSKVYNAYWMRFGFGASSDSALVINYIGHRFCDDNALFSFYPILNNSTIMTRYEAGKTDWTEQQTSASKIIIADLKSRNLILSKDQILDISRFELPCVYKTAELIFMGLGTAFAESMANARSAYSEIMNTDDFGIDLNRTGNLERSEKKTTARIMTR